MPTTYNKTVYIFIALIAAILVAGAVWYYVRIVEQNRISELCGSGFGELANKQDIRKILSSYGRIVDERYITIEIINPDEYGSFYNFRSVEATGTASGDKCGLYELYDIKLIPKNSIHG